MQIETGVLLAPFTTLRIGGPAKYFAEVETEDELLEALWFAKAGGLPVFVLGGGSNILVADEGFEGLVIRICFSGISESGELNGKLRLTAAAGEDWDSFVEYCVDRRAAGIENLSGIPGFLGGTPVQNVGAYGQEVSDTIVSVKCLDRQNDGIVVLDHSACDFSYRTSIFNSIERDRYIVLAVTFDLDVGGEVNISYKDLREHFAGRKPSVEEVRQAVLAIRRSKSMVIDHGDPNRMSAGSFFKNPIVTLEVLAEMNDRFGPVPSFPFQDAAKVPAAWLIEHAGFHKGFRLGNAGISSNHTLALINCGGATASEIIALKDLIQDRVNERFGINLVPEPTFVGFA